MHYDARILLFYLTSVLFLTLPATAQEADPDLSKLVISEAPAISRDGSTLIFVSNATGQNTIWISNTDGTHSRPLLNNVGGSVWSGFSQKDPDWSPDGKNIIFSSSRGSSGVFNIWKVDRTGTTASQLTNTTGNSDQPRFSPDGTTIAFVSKRHLKRELWSMTADGLSQTPIAYQQLNVSEPSWSPDGQSLVYVGCIRPSFVNNKQSSAGSCNLYKIAISSGVTTQITSGSFMDWNPTWGVMGIVFASNRNGYQGLWMTSGGADSPMLVTNPESNGDLSPTWNSKTNSLMFTRVGAIDDLSGSNVWSLSLGGIAKQVTFIRGFIPSGDINTDGVVDCSDLAIIKASFGQRQGQSRFDSRADLNGDGIVDVRDLATESQKLKAGTVCP